jgi:hypothetical protein
MTTSQVVAAAVVLGGAGLYVWAVSAARRHSWGPRTLVALSTLSGLALIVMVLTDWPGEQLDLFWADHSVLAAMLSTLLLISLGYLAFEAGETKKQVALNKSVTSAGVSGLVGHLMDLDIAVAMLADPLRPKRFSVDGSPLSWVRPLREDLQRRAAEKADAAKNTAVGEIEEATGHRAASKVRFRVDDWPRRLADYPHTAWREELLDQGIRRTIAGMRDWAALISVSDDGRRVLMRFGQVRLSLLALGDGIRAHADQKPEVLELRRYLQFFAFALERVSSPEHLRAGIVTELINTSEKFPSLLAKNPPTIGEAMELLGDAPDVANADLHHRALSRGPHLQKSSCQDASAS